MAEFIAYDRVDPWDQSRADLRAGIIASVIANVNRGKKSKTFSARDFMPYAQAEHERQRITASPKGKSLNKKVRGVLGALAEKVKK